VLLPLTRVILWLFASPEPVYYDFSAPDYPYSCYPYYGDLYFGFGLGWGFGWGFTGCWGWGGWVGEDAAGVVTLTAVPGTAMDTTAMGIMAMAMLTMAMATVTTGMAIRMDRPAGIIPGRPIPADTQVGMPDQVEDLRGGSLGDTPGLSPQQDIRADLPPLGGANPVRRPRDTPPQERQLEQAVRPQQEQLRLGRAKLPGLSKERPHPRGLQQGQANR